MWKLKSFLLPCENYNELNQNDVIKFENVVNKISEKDEFFIPKEFYDIEDKKGITATDYLYGYENACDVSEYVLDIISKTKTKYTEHDYHNLFQNISQLQGSFVNLGFRNIVCKMKDYLIVVKCDITKVKRIYIKKASDYIEFQERAIDCYPNLVFHPDAFLNIHKLGNIDSEINELVRHLGVLCDAGKDEYYQNGRDENATLRVLKSKHKINCSGKGSNEKTKFNKNMKIQVDGEDEDFEYKLNCNSHTKFYDGNNDQRIYFCWGRDEINEHDIIIVHIGDHWN